MEGQVITPQSVTVPVGKISATFTTTPTPEVIVPHWVFIGAHYGTSGGMQARLLEVDPAPGVPTLLAIGPAGQDVIGGQLWPRLGWVSHARPGWRCNREPNDR